MKFEDERIDSRIKWPGKKIYWYIKTEKETNKDKTKEKKIYKMTKLEKERLNHVYKELVEKRKYRNEFSNFLFDIFHKCANIVNYYNFTYVREHEKWYAFTNHKKAEKYIKKHKDAYIEPRENWDMGTEVVVKFTEKPDKDGKMTAKEGNSIPF